jgi:hypothetical protein
MELGGHTMPTETIIAIAGIVLAFGAFAIALAWSDYYSSKAQQEQK